MTEINISIDASDLPPALLEQAWEVTTNSPYGVETHVYESLEDALGGLLRLALGGIRHGDTGDRLFRIEPGQEQDAWEDLEEDEPEWRSA